MGAAGAAALPHHVDDVEVDVLDADLGEFLQSSSRRGPASRNRYRIAVSRRWSKPRPWQTSKRRRSASSSSRTGPAPRDGWRLEAPHGVGDLFLALEPGVEAVQGAEAVVGGGRPPTLQDVNDVVLNVGGGGVGQTPPALVQEPAELFERLGVGVDGALGLALGPERPARRGGQGGLSWHRPWAEGGTSYVL